MNGHKKKRKAPRLNHKKSKAGCQRCKARRVKCDEVHPICGGCERHEVECVWTPEFHDDGHGNGTATPSISSHTATCITSSLSSASPGLSVSTASDSAERRLLDLTLLHNFTTRTALHMGGADVPVIRDLWQKDAPALALEHPPLLSAMLASSAYHLAQLQPQHADKYVAAAEEYSSRAVRDHRAAIAALSPETADKVTMTSILMSVLTLRDLRADAFDRRDERQEDSTKPAASDTFQRMVFIQGTHATIGMAVDRSGPDSIPLLMRMMQHLRGTWDQRRAARRALGEKVADEEPKLPRGYKDAIELLFTPAFSNQNKMDGPAPMAAELEDQATVQLYFDAVDHCTAILRSVVSGQYEPQTVAQLVCTACATFPKAFLDLVQEGRPRAMIIMAHIWGMMRSCRDMFWIGNIPVRDANCIAEDLGDEWRPYLAWLLEWVKEAPTEPVGPLP